MCSVIRMMRMTTVGGSFHWFCEQRGLGVGAGPGNQPTIAERLKMKKGGSFFMVFFFFFHYPLFLDDLHGFYCHEEWNF